MNITAETVARTFFDTWVAHFSCLAILMTDQGRQFESALFFDLCTLCGIKENTYHHLPSTKQWVGRAVALKTSLCCHGSLWTEALPLVRLVLRSVY